MTIGYVILRPQAEESLKRQLIVRFGWRKTYSLEQNPAILNMIAPIQGFFTPLRSVQNDMRRRKPAATHSEMREDGIILDYRDDVVVGLTVLEASQR